MFIISGPFQMMVQLEEYFESEMFLQEMERYSFPQGHNALYSLDVFV